ncbi:Spore coat polysaccharide biosynthesis protein SpsF [Flavobacterium sp. 9AF]|uniref:glutamate-1-semialdehyde 2,1-aminomutase n=1 Tax=Flavobacterium sp. 9AF TaxID=2653142 RepID=UPI0012F200FE|nr:glutamate-1-semialdehyde 2,1-aminomutase [Flavobacterium sp. 9AF]VXC13193.1 Spore coat polysaccharide biosynthesis protein SpsF [Flavobacterium sp. 9AF]
MVKIIGITQARIGSSRLPRKVLLPIQGKTLLEYHLERIKQSKLVNEWLVATTNEEHSNTICEIASNLGLAYYKGDLYDVLDRFYQSVKNKNADYVVRVTSDCPLIDPALIDETVDFCLKENLDYFSNVFEDKYPDGLDIEVFSFYQLKKAWENATLKADREHVTPYIRRSIDLSKYSNNYIDSKYASLRMTVDEMSDFKVISHLIDNLGANQSWKVYADYLLNNIKIKEINSSIIRNQGYMKSKFEEIKLRNITNFVASDEYRNTIHKLIPGGCHTYSKGDDQFPILSPAAIKRGKGAYIWDIDGNQFLDCSMGLTSVSLGHAYQPVIDAVKEELENGVNFQRPSYLEKETAEKFLELVPGHDMIKFSKNGSIVTTAAVKLARAFTGRKLVAFPGDHPFYSYDDWFIGKTACNKGVPNEITELSVTFKGCSIQSLKELFEKYPNQIACVITEPEKNQCATGICEHKSVEEFLNQAIELCHKNGALFIADEMVTGFKTDFPGTITKYNIVPDMATWGKGIANGFSFCALTGKKEIMELGGILNEGQEKVFLISTTHGGETHGLTAALATIDVYKNNNVIEHNHALGKKMIELCNQLIHESELQDYVTLMPSVWMPVFVFKNIEKEPCQGFRTLFMQEMIHRGILFQGAFVPCFSHTEDDIYYFAKAFKESLDVYKKALEVGYEKFLVGSPAKAVFRKLL